MKFSCSAAVLALFLLACGSGEGERAADGANQAAANAAAANESAAAEPGAAACPFRRTREWVGSVERGHVRINGYVDVQMAGFRPALTERAGAAPGTLALDLAFAEPLDPVRHAKLLEIADKCPVHRTLMRGFEIRTTLGPPDRHPSGEPPAEHERQMEQACAD